MDQRSTVAWDNDEAKACIAKYDRMVRAMARRLARRAAVGRVLDEDDLHAEGRVAILEALSSYRGFGISEAGWVRTRVRQRMIDAIRRFDPRNRAEMRLVVKHAAGKTSGQEAEIARVLGARHLVSLEARGAGDGESLGARLADTQVPRADEAAHANRQRERLQALVPSLPGNERVVFELRLFEGASLKDVGQKLGISAGRVCQLQLSAVRRLSLQLAA